MLPFTQKITQYLLIAEKTSTETKKQTMQSQAESDEDWTVAQTRCMVYHKRGVHDES